jgi:drug/metabolite transporter (DMT)-like permease
MRPRDRPGSAVLAVALCLIWALTFIAQRTALREAGPLWIAAGRTVIGALALAPALRTLSPRGWRAAAALGLTNVVGFVGLQLIGLKAIGAGPSAAIVYTQPVLVAVGAHLWLAERLTRARAGGALIGLAGVTVVSAHELSAASVGAVAALLGSAVCWAAGTLITRATPEQPVLGVVALQHALAAPVLLAVAAVGEPFPALSGRLAGTVLYAGVLGAAGGQLLFTVLLRRGEASVVAAWMFSVPITAAVLGVVLLGEPLRAPLVVGLALVSLGVWLATRPAPRAPDAGSRGTPADARPSGSGRGRASP